MPLTVTVQLGLGLGLARFHAFDRHRTSDCSAPYFQAAQVEALQQFDGQVQQLFSLLDAKHRGWFTKASYVNAAGGDFGLFEKMGPDANGRVTADAFSRWIAAIKALSKFQSPS